MHDGTAQDPQAARALVARARSVLIRLTSDVFGVDLLNLRVTEFITSRRLRHALREADKRNVEGSYAQVASIAVWSFEFLMSRWSRFVASLAEGKSARTESPEPVVAAVSAGVHIPDLKRFRDATDQVVSHMTVSGRIETTDLGWQTRRDAARQREDARFALEFVSGLALQIEGRMIGFPSGDPYDDALPAE